MREELEIQMIKHQAAHHMTTTKMRKRMHKSRQSSSESIYVETIWMMMIDQADKQTLAANISTLTIFCHNFS